MSSAAPVYLSKEVYGTEKGEPEMPIKNVTFDSGFMLYNPKWKIHSDSLVPQEVEAFGFSIGLEQIPEVATNPHCYSLAENITIGIELGGRVCGGFTDGVDISREGRQEKEKLF